MKKLVPVIVAAAAAVGVFLYVQPILAVRSVAAALEEGDAEGLKDHIDFDAVREGLKGEVLARLQLGDASDDAAGALGAAVVGTAVEAMMTSITPEGLAQGGHSGPAEIVGSGYETTARFHAEIDRGHGPITVVLRRQGTTWRVTAIKPAELTWREIELYRRNLTAEAGATLKAIFEHIAARHDTLGPSDAKVIAIPQTPSEPPCGKPYTWTDEDIAAWSVIGFVPPGPTNYSYSVKSGPDAGFDDGITMMVAEAVSDLDCNGSTSFFSLAMGENPDGLLFRPPAVYSEDALE